MFFFIDRTDRDLEMANESQTIFVKYTLLKTNTFWLNVYEIVLSWWFADSFHCIFSLNFLPKGPIDKNPYLV